MAPEDIDAALDLVFAETRRALRKVICDVAGSDTAAADRPVTALLLRFDDAAALCSMSRTAVFNLVKKGALPAVEIEGVGRRIRRSDLDVFVSGLGAS
jgi:excisionase family DNA binding protein